MKEIKFYFYNGFDKPKLLATNLKDLKANLYVEDSFMGDVTNETLEGVTDLLNDYDYNIKKMQEYNDNCYNNVWIEPTLHNLVDYNTGVMIDEYLYLDDFVKATIENTEFENYSLDEFNEIYYADIQKYDDLDVITDKLESVDYYVLYISYNSDDVILGTLDIDDKHKEYVSIDNKIFIVMR